MTDLQIEIDFEAGLTKRYSTLMEVVNASVRGCGRNMKAVAADMDLSNSDLSRKLAENRDDTRRLQVGELESLIEACGDAGKDIVYWMVEKYLEDPARRRDRALDMLTEMAPVFMDLMKQAMPDGQSVGLKS